MHAARIEEEDPIQRLDASPMRVAVNYRVRVRKPSSQGARQASMWSEVAEAQGPRKRVRLLEQAASVAVDEHYPLASDHDLAGCRKRSEHAVVIAPHGFDRCQAPQVRERFLPIDVARMQDEVDPLESLEDSRGQPVEELGAVRIRDDADFRRQECRIRGSSLVDTGCGKPGRMGGGCVSAGVQRMQRGCREGVRLVLVQVQIDVR